MLLSLSSKWLDVISKLMCRTRVGVWGSCRYKLSSSRTAFLLVQWLKRSLESKGKGTKWDGGQNPVTASVLMDAAVPVWS